MAFYALFFKNQPSDFNLLFTLASVLIGHLGSAKGVSNEEILAFNILQNILSRQTGLFGTVSSVLQQVVCCHGRLQERNLFCKKCQNLLHYSMILNDNRKDDVCVAVRSQWKTVNLMNFSRL